MKFIQGNSRQQIQMLSLDDFISSENPVRFIDAFVHKLELENWSPDYKKVYFHHFLPIYSRFLSQNSQTYFLTTKIAAYKMILSNVLYLLYQPFFVPFS